MINKGGNIMIIENYITVLAFSVIFKAILKFVLFIKSRKQPFRKGFMQRMMGRYSLNFRLLLQLSIIWLLTFFFSYIKIVAELIYLYVMFIPPTI